MSIVLTLGWWLIPTILSIYIIYKMYKFNSENSGGGPYDFSPIFSLLFLIPILIIWIIYLSLCLIFS